MVCCYIIIINALATEYKNVIFPIHPTTTPRNTFAILSTVV